MPIRSADIQRAAGISYRQLDYWRGQRWLVPYERPSWARSGTPIEWPEIARQKATIMGRLIKAGISADRAHEYAQAFLDSKSKVHRLWIGDGLMLAIARNDTLLLEGIPD